MVSWFRLAAGLSFFILLWLAFVSRLIAGWIVLGPVAVFVGLAIYHVRLSRQDRRATRGVAFYESGLDRIEDRWVGRGSSGAA
jgi:F0F1-type ATP synthase assembly protein I